MVNFRVQYKDLLGMFGYFMKDIPIDIMEKDFSDEEIGKAFGVSVKAFRTGKKISLRKKYDCCVPRCSRRRQATTSFLHALYLDQKTS